MTAGTVRRGRLTRPERRRRRSLLLAAATLVAVALAFGLDATGALRRVELGSIDARFSVRGTQPQPPEVAVVGIDATTLREIDRFPFSRKYHAEVIDKLRRDGAKVIAYDVQFTEQTTPEDDEALIAAVERAHGKTVLSTTEVADDGTTAVLGGDETLHAIDAKVGNTIAPADPGGVIRRMPERYDGLDGFAVVAAELALGRHVDRSRFHDGEAWIDYHGPARTLQVVSMADVLKDRYRKGTFRDKVVVIGATAPTLQDVKATSASGSGVMSGPEIQAEAISTILRDFPLRDTPDWLGVALLLLFAAAAPFLSSRFGAKVAFAIALLLGAGWLLAAQLAFDAGRILPVAEPMTGLVFAAVATLAVLLTVESMERRRTHDFFARFVPESVVGQVMAQADGDLRLGGVRKECTVLFSDLRGFTSYGEPRPPEEVIDVLNDYLGEMSDAILDHGGTLVAYMGDGIMAVYGAPLDQHDHADRALATAREMLVRVERFNDRMRASGQGEGFRMGIGINTGPVVSGNVGSQRRMEYTTIGDAVNTASRIEGMTKGTPFQVFVADSTRAVLVAEPPADLVLVDDFEVRGREATIRLWGLLEDGMDVPPGANGALAAGAAPEG
jgi:adenylate cyclase